MEEEKAVNPSADAGNYIIQILFDGKPGKQLLALNATIQIVKLPDDAHVISTL